MSGPTGSPGAQYRCQRCSHEWTDRAGPVQCPVCEHLYVTWLNYEEMFGKRPLK